jgi:hypothetical protein
LPDIIPISDLRQDTAEILRILAGGDAEVAAGLGRDAEDVMAEARALLAQK